MTDIAHPLVRDARCSRGLFFAMKDHSAMSQLRLETCIVTARAAARHNCVRESLLLTLMLYGIVRGSQALAGDQLSLGESAAKLDVENLQHRFNAAPESLPDSTDFLAPVFSARPLTDVEVFSETEFRPRRRARLDADLNGNGNSIIDAPMTRENSVWQQMGEFQSQDRLRLLTLWQMRGSSLSLQAGRRGAPSLQWSTPWVRRERASRGVFDHLLVISPRLLEAGPRNNSSRLAAGAPGMPKSLEAGPSIASK